VKVKDESIKKASRLTTLDLLRGFFLFVIIVDHVELYPSIIDIFSGKGRLFVSAAEGFFFISGLLVGYIYRRKIALGMRYVCNKLWNRAGILYFWATALTLISTLWGVSLAGHYVKYGLPANINWTDIIWQTLTFQYTYGWGDFLNRYVPFMLLAPLVIYLLSKNMWWIVAVCSIAVWSVRGEHFTWAWQLVFMGGIVAGYYWEKLKSSVLGWKPITRKVVVGSIYTLAAVTFTVSYLSAYLLSWLNDNLASLPTWVQSFTLNWNNWNQWIWQYLEKWTLEPGRLILFCLWFAAAYLLLDKHSAKLPKVLTNWLILLGTNSLFVYGFHALVIFGLHVFVNGSLGLINNFLITVATLGVITLVVWFKTQKFSIAVLFDFARSRLNAVRSAVSGQKVPGTESYVSETVSNFAEQSTELDNQKEVAGEYKPKVTTQVAEGAEG
jgi:hypothetical protein